MGGGNKPSVFTALTRGEMSARGGCQGKLPALDLEVLLARSLEQSSRSGARLAIAGYPDDSALVDAEGVRLLLSTELTPVVGIDMVAAGRIAALHAMSDIYASGGYPKWALINLVVDPEQPAGVAEAIMTGILSQCQTEGATVAGGHTVIGREAMVGLSVIGVPRGARVLRKKGAVAGDVLLLSKPLGVGLIQRAFKLGLAAESALRAAVTAMTTSNGPASEHVLEASAHACTDVSGFGLLGHLAEMLTPECGATLELSAIPVIPEARALPPEVARTVWIENNYENVRTRRTIDGVIELHRLSALLDPQTNGGLLVAVTPENAARLIEASFVNIGQVTGGSSFEIVG
jgi:selenide,water dikinase